MRVYEVTLTAECVVVLQAESEDEARQSARDSVSAREYRFSTSTISADLELTETVKVDRLSLYADVSLLP